MVSIFFFYPYFDDSISSFNERVKSNLDILTSLPCLIPSKVYAVGRLFYDVKLDYDFYKDNLNEYLIVIDKIID